MISTAVNLLSAEASGGGIFVSNTGALTIGSFDAVTSTMTQGGDIGITSDVSITANVIMDTNGGDLTLTAGNGVTAGQADTDGGAYTIDAGTGTFSQTGNLGTAGTRSGAVSITAADIALTAQLFGQSTLEVIPSAPASSIGLGGGSGDLNLDDTELGFLVDGFSSITIGDTLAGAGTVDIDTATFNDPITIAGGTINDAAGTDIAAGTNAVTLDGNVALQASHPEF